MNDSAMSEPDTSADEAEQAEIKELTDEIIEESEVIGLRAELQELTENHDAVCTDLGKWESLAKFLAKAVLAESPDATVIARSLLSEWAASDRSQRGVAAVNKWYARWMYESMFGGMKAPNGEWMRHKQMRVSLPECPVYSITAQIEATREPNDLMGEQRQRIAFLEAELARLSGVEATMPYEPPAPAAERPAHDTDFGEG